MVLLPIVSKGAQECWGSSAEPQRMDLRFFPLKDGKWVFTPSFFPYGLKGGPALNLLHFWAPLQICSETEKLT